MLECPENEEKTDYPAQPAFLARLDCPERRGTLVCLARLGSLEHPAFRGPKVINDFFRFSKISFQVKWAYPAFPARRAMPAFLASPDWPAYLGKKATPAIRVSPALKDCQDRLDRKDLR